MVSFFFKHQFLVAAFIFVIMSWNFGFRSAEFSWTLDFVLPYLSSNNASKNSGNLNKINYKWTFECVKMLKFKKILQDRDHRLTSLLQLKWFVWATLRIVKGIEFLFFLIC